MPFPKVLAKLINIKQGIQCHHDVYFGTYVLSRKPAVIADFKVK